MKGGPDLACGNGNGSRGHALEYEERIFLPLWLAFMCEVDHADTSRVPKFTAAFAARAFPVLVGRIDARLTPARLEDGGSLFSRAWPRPASVLPHREVGAASKARDLAGCMRERAAALRQASRRGKDRKCLFGVYSRRHSKQSGHDDQSHRRDRDRHDECELRPALTVWRAIAHGEFSLSANDRPACMGTSVVETGVLECDRSHAG